MNGSTLAVGRDVMLAAASLAVYLGAVHIASFAFGLPSARLAGVGAVAILNVLIAAELWLSRRSLPLRRSSPDAPATLWVLRGAALLALLAVAALHVDYLVARGRGAHYGRFDTATLKVWLIMSQIAFLAFAALARSSALRGIRSLCAIDRIDVSLFALVLVPLVNYVARNSGFTFVETVGYFTTLTGIAMLVALALVAYQRLLNARPFAVPLVVALVFVHYSMPMVSAALARPIEFLFPVQLSLALVLPALMAAVYLANRRALQMFVLLFSIASAAGSFLMAPAEAAIDRPSVDGGVRAPREGLSTALAAPLERRPGVYLLVYDSYAPRQLMARYGIDNSSADAFLERHDFTSYDEAYSLYHATYRGMSALMNMGPPPGAGIAGPSAAVEFFKAHGYKTHLVLHAYLLGGDVPRGADYTFPSRARRSALDTLYRGIAAGEFQASFVFEDLPHEEWVATKRQVLGARLPQPKMVYAHSGMPGHSQNSGRCLPDETERYAARLARANQEMEQDISTILAADNDAIIIVAGDHGPYLTGDCLYMEATPPGELTADHLADRYGTKLAIRWPGGPPPFDPPATIQDVFFSVAAFLLDDDAVLRYRLPRITSGYMGLPDGAIKDGIVTIGRDRGRPLFPGAR